MTAPLEIQKHILIVDDLVTNLKYAQEVLKDKYKLTLVKSGEKALEYLESNIPDLILLDINMPCMDGYETIRRIKADPRINKIPVIFLTVESDKESELKGFKLGAQDFITKPFDIDIMLSRINAHLEMYTYRMELERMTGELSESGNLVQTTKDVQLTKREKEVVELAILGKSNKLIANELFISEHTVKWALSSVFKKCGASSREELKYLL